MRTPDGRSRPGQLGQGVRAPRASQGRAHAEGLEPGGAAATTPQAALGRGAGWSLDASARRRAQAGAASDGRVASGDVEGGVAVALVSLRGRVGAAAPAAPGVGVGWAGGVAGWRPELRGRASGGVAAGAWSVGGVGVGVGRRPAGWNWDGGLGG